MWVVGLNAYYDHDNYYEACGYICPFYLVHTFMHIYIRDVYNVFCMNVFPLYGGLGINK